MKRHRHPLDDLDADIRDHLDRETADNIDRGMTPDTARAAALRKFGSIAIAKEDARAVWIPVWLDQLMQDARYGLRMIRRTPAFSAVVMLTLALGIGLTTAVFSVVNAVLVRPLSFPDADRLVWIATAEERSNEELVMSPDLTAWREQAQSLERVAGFFIGGERIDVGDEVIQARVVAATDGFWDLAGARPALGTAPRPGEPGIVLSHAFFERWFHGDPRVVGRAVPLNGRPTTITGVLPPGFRVQLPPPPAWSGVQSGDVDFYRAAIVQPPPGPPGPTTAVQLFEVIGRLKPGVSLARAHDELDAIRANTEKPFFGKFRPRRLRTVPLADKIVGGARRSLIVLLAAVVLVLLIACANVANLLLARGSARQREVAIRTAVGAGRSRMLRQFLVESLVLAAIGGAAGVLAARLALAGLVRVLPEAVPRLVETTMDARVIAFASAVSVATAVACGLAPAFTARKANVHDVLKDGARTASASAGSLRVRKTLVAAELALSVVLLVGAGLMLRSFWRITAYPAGFAPDRVLTMRMQFSGPTYRETASRIAYVDELLRRARSAPGVEAAGVSTNGDSRMRLEIEGANVPPEVRPSAVVSVVSDGYAAAIGMRVVKGRWVRDDEPAPVFVMNEALARQSFEGQDPIGKRIRLPFLGTQRFATVVGVVADLKYSNLDTRSEPELFTDFRHARPFGLTIAMRLAGDPATAAPPIRALLTGADRTQPIFDVKRLDAALADSIAPRRFNLLLLGAFAGAAFVLALVGIYGLIAYSVAQRTQEIGVRMALGAERREVVRMIVRQGMAIAAVGIAAGVAAALALTRAIASLLYDVASTDPPTFVAVAGMLAVTALAASCGPAIKGALVDPIVALRCE